MCLYTTNFRDSKLNDILYIYKHVYTHTHTKKLTNTTQLHGFILKHKTTIYSSMPFDIPKCIVFNLYQLKEVLPWIDSYGI